MRILDFFEQKSGTLTPSADAFQLFPKSSRLQPSAHTIFRLAGLVVAKALYECMLLGTAELNPAFLNLLLNRYNSIDDVKWVDPEIHKNILSVKEYPGDVKDLGLSFSYSRNGVCGPMEFDLLPNGKSMQLDNESRVQFVLLLANHIANTCLQEPLNEFQKGFYSILSSSWLRFFDAEELQHLISGVRQKGFNVDDLKMHTVYHGYNANDPTVQDLWTVLNNWDPDMRTKFLLFATSTDKAPLLGFASLEPLFAVSKHSGDLSALPSVSTCTNMLKLPDYKNVNILDEKLRRAVSDSAGFYVA